MRPPTYAAARAAAATVEAVFARHLETAVAQGLGRLAPVPDASTIAALVDAAFWASLRREEGRSPRISLAFVPPEQTGEPLRLERRLPLAPGPLARLAPAVERPGIHLGVWHDGDDLFVWGATRNLPNLCLVLEVVEPGLLVVKYRRGEEYGKYGNVAVLRGDLIQVVDESSARLPDCPALLAPLLGFDTTSARLDSTNLLVQLAVSMRGHGHGGTLLVVPNESATWRESIVHPIPYAVSPAFSRLASLAQQPAEAHEGIAWQDAVRRLVEGIAGLTAVDGATIMTDRYELLAFGAKIGRRDGRGAVERVTVTEPVMGNTPRPVAPVEIGGTRHLSAAQFVHDQPDALALVASQDGHFTIFSWAACDAMVHAHRIETLLL